MTGRLLLLSRLSRLHMLQVKYSRTCGYACCCLMQLLLLLLALTPS
jgi:hypothetical protein